MNSDVSGDIYTDSHYSVEKGDFLRSLLEDRTNMFGSPRGKNLDDHKTAKNFSF
jgi:hypothetical protein